MRHGEHCPAHDPNRAAARHRSASRAGRARHDQEVRLLKEELKATIAGVKDGSLDRNDAAVMFQGYRTLKDYIQLERDGVILPELAERLEALKSERDRAS